jgi:hypothetical protein
MRFKNSINLLMREIKAMKNIFKWFIQTSLHSLAKIIFTVV